MQPLKDTTGRHGVGGGGGGGGVEMTMSLSGPPGFSHHTTTVPSDSLHQYMNTPQHSQHGRKSTHLQQQHQQQQQQQHHHHHQQQQQQHIPQQSPSLHEVQRGPGETARSGGHDHRLASLPHRPHIHDIQHSGQDIRSDVPDYRGSSGLDPRVVGGHESRLTGEVHHRRMDGRIDPFKELSHREMEMHHGINPRLLQHGPPLPASRDHQKGSIESGLPRQHQHQQHHQQRSNSPSPSSTRRGSLEPKDSHMPPSSRYNSHTGGSSNGYGNRTSVQSHAHPGVYNMGPGSLDASKHPSSASVESMRSSARGVDSNTPLMLEMRTGPGTTPLQSPALRGFPAEARLAPLHQGRDTSKAAYDNPMPGVCHPHIPPQSNSNLQAGSQNSQVQNVRGMASSGSSNPPDPYSVKPSSYSRAPSGSFHGSSEQYISPQVYHQDAPHLKHQQQGVFPHGPESQRIYPPKPSASAGNGIERSSNLQRVEPGLVGKSFPMESQYPGFAGIPSYELRELAREHLGNMAATNGRDSTRSYGQSSSVLSNQSASAMTSSPMASLKGLSKSSADPHQLSLSSHHHRSPSEEGRRSHHNLINDPQSHFQHKSTSLGPPQMNSNFHMQTNKHPTQMKDNSYPHAMPTTGRDQLVLRTADSRGGDETMASHGAYSRHPPNLPLQSSTTHKPLSVIQDRGMPPMSSSTHYPNLVDNQKLSAPVMHGTPLHLMSPEDQRRVTRQDFGAHSLDQQHTHRSGEFPRVASAGSVHLGSKHPPTGHSNENFQGLSVIESAARQQGSISTGQPRIIYDENNANKHNSRPSFPHAREVIARSDQRYPTSRNRDNTLRAGDRPASQSSSQDTVSGTKAGLGLQTSNSSEKSASDALDLTRLQRSTRAGGDCPLDLTVKAKKRPHVDDRETPDYDRMYLAAKRPKLASQSSHGSDSNSPRPSGIHLKSNSSDSANNPVWISSPSPSYDNLRPPVSPAFSVSSSSSTPKTPKLSYGSLPVGDHRANSADLRFGQGEIHGGSAVGSDGGRASVDSSRAGSTGRGTPISPHPHHLKYNPPGLGSVLTPGQSAQVKVPGLPMDPKFVNNGSSRSSNSNPPTQMVPLTTQLQKMKEEQAHQMKTVRMEPGVAPYNGHINQQHYTSAEPGKKTFRDIADPSPAVSISNEVVVVRHRQQNLYENDPKREGMQVPSGMSNAYTKPMEQEQHTGLDKLQPLQHHHQQQQQRQYGHHEQQQHLQHQKMIGQHDIIELGMKDSSDPLQASRMMPTGHSQGYPSQVPTNSQQQISQHQQHQLYMQQQQHPQQNRQQLQRMPKNQPPQLSQLSPNTFQQQLQYQKDLVLQQHHQQVKQQQQQRQQYRQQQQQQQKQQQQQIQSNPYRAEDVNHVYFKHQQEQQQRKKSGESNQSSLNASQKWNAQVQQRKQQALTTSSYPNLEKTYCPSDFRRSPKSAYPGTVVYRKPDSAAPSTTNLDGAKSYSRQDRCGRLGDPGPKSLLPQIAGPLPEGGVREESRRALSRRVSYSGPVDPEPQRRQTQEVTSDFPQAMRPEYNPNSITVKPRATSISSSRDSVRASKDKTAPNRMETKASIATVPFIDKVDERSKSETPVVKDSSRPPSANMMPGDSVQTHTPLLLHPSSSPAPSTQSQSVRDGSPLPVGGNRQASQSPGQFAVPLSVNIPPSNSPLTVSDSPSPAGQAPSIPSGLPPGSKAKAWSRKHMILSAVSQDESLKKIISTSVPSGSKHEAGGLSSECKSRILASSSGSGSPLPTSPKMPILSPQEGEGDECGRGQGDDQCAQLQSAGNNNDGPPTLDPIKRGQAKQVGNRTTFSNPPSNGTSSCPSTPAVFRPSSPPTASDGPLVKESPETAGNRNCPSITSTNNNSQDVANHNSTAKMAPSTVTETHLETNVNSSSAALATSISMDTTNSTSQDTATSVQKSEDLAGNTIVVRRISLGSATPAVLPSDLQQKQQLQPPAQSALGPDELAQKGTASFPRAEVIRRNSLTSHSLGPWGHVKNIPVANVAPFVHSPVVEEENKNKSRHQAPQQQTQNKQPPDHQQQYQMTLIQQQASASEALLSSTIKTELPSGDAADNALSKTLPPSSDIITTDMQSSDDATVTKLEAVISEGKMSKKKMKRKKKQLEEELADAIESKDMSEALAGAGSSSCKKALVKTAMSTNPASPPTKMMMKKKGLDKLRVSSPTKMKELELLGASVEYAVLKSTTSDVEEIKALKELVEPSGGGKGKTQHSAAPLTVERIKYKHKIVRERNTRVPRSKKTSKKRAVAQIVSDDDEDDEDDDDDDNNGGDDEDDEDENEEDNDDNDDDDEEFGGDGGKKRKSKKKKDDAESRARDREERALRREQLRDQSEEGRCSRHASSRTGGQSTRSSSRETTKTTHRSSKSRRRTRSKDSAPPGKSKLTKPSSSRISRRRLSSTNQRAQELKHNALAQRRKTGKRKLGPYNRNAAYEQELHREANRRAAVRAKRQASSRARERLQQQQRRLLRDDDDDDDDDEDDEEEGEAAQEAGAKGVAEEEEGKDEVDENDADEVSATRKKETRRAEDKPIPVREAAKPGKTTGRGAGGKGSKDKTNNSAVSAVHGQGHGNGKTCQPGQAVSVAGPSTSHKEDYESDVEDVPYDLAKEMASSEGRRKKVAGTPRSGVKVARAKQCDSVTHESETEDCDEEEPCCEKSKPGDATEDLLASIPVESMPVPADLKKMTVNKNSGETLLHRAARLGHEEITLYCLRTQTVHVNARDNAGYTPLHESCVRGSVQVARHLIYYGADVNCCSQEGIRPIHDAIENDHIEVVRLLLVHGADPLIATYAGRTPVRIARSLSMLQTLQGYIGDLNGWSDGGEDDDEEEDEERVEEIPWRFTSSLTFHESKQEEKYSPCVDLPGSPADDSGDVFDDGPTSAINVFHLALEGEDRTPQPFSLLDEVLNRLAIPRDKLSGLYEWTLSSVTLSSERVREVASCCCSNVSIRLPQSGEVTLLPLTTLREIETALRKQGSSAWLVGSASAGPSGRPGPGSVKIKKEPLDGFVSSSSSSSSTVTSVVTTSQIFFAQTSGGGKNSSSSVMGSRTYSSTSGSSTHSYNNNNTSSSGNTSLPVCSDKPLSVKRSDALSRVPILTKMEQQAGGFTSSSASQHLSSSDPLSTGSGSFRSKQVLQPARDLFHPVSSGSTVSSSQTLKGKTPSAFSHASASSSFSTTTTTTSGLGGIISSSISSSSPFFSKHTKLKTASSFPFSSSPSSPFSSSLSLNQQKSSSYQTLHSSWSPQKSSSSPSFSSSEQNPQQHHHQQQQQHPTSHQSLKKTAATDHHRINQQQQSHQLAKQQKRSTPPSHISSSSVSSFGKGTPPSSSKEARSSVSSSGSSSQRKAKKDDPEGSWLNAPMFSDDSSSSPFHTSIDFDSENSD